MTDPYAPLAVEELPGSDSPAELLLHLSYEVAGAAFARVFFEPLRFGGTPGGFLPLGRRFERQVEPGFALRRLAHDPVHHLLSCAERVVAGPDHVAEGVAERPLPLVRPDGRLQLFELAQVLFLRLLQALEFFWRHRKVECRMSSDE